jgi:tetratricopeptide (TPR) repeat protein
MAQPDQEDPHPLTKRELRTQRLLGRMMRGTDQSPEATLKQSQDVLEWALRKHAPDSSFSIKAMLDVADQLAGQDRVAEEVLLREQIVTSLRQSLGPEHASTLNAESKLATCLINLERFEEAQLLLSHVVAGKALALGEDDPETLVAMAWSAIAAKRLGRLDDARALQEQIVTAYELRGIGESAQAMLASLNLAATLTELHDLEAASLLLRHVLDVRSRTLGPEDPKTLDVLQVLAAVMMTTNRPEAKVMAQSLVETRARVHGPDSEGTIAARRLLASIEGYGDGS